MSQLGSKRVWLIVLLVGAVVLFVPVFLAVGWFVLARQAQSTGWRATESHAVQASSVVASFLADFQPD